MGAEGVSDYATRLQAFIEAHAPLRVMAVLSQSTFRDYWSYETEVRIKKGGSCDCCGTKRLKRCRALLDRNGKVQRVGLDCFSNLRDFNHIIYERPDTPPEELKYETKS